MQTWQQLYSPLGSLGLSALAAVIPIVFFFLALAVFRLKGHVAGSITLALSILVAIFAFQMPVDMAFAAAGYGFAYGLWPIAWIIVAAVFLYKLTVKSGQFEIIRSSVLSITDDQRLQVLLIGFCFGAFLEGAAGFGAPVAITAALLVGLGFNPLYAAGLCLIANTAPVAFGALGIPIIVAGQVTGIDAFKIGAMTGRQLPLLSLFVPFWLVFMMDGLRASVKPGRQHWWPA
jgi:lactate permease